MLLIDANALEGVIPPQNAQQRTQGAKPRKGHTVPSTTTPKAIATEWGISPKLMRKFLRSSDSGLAGKAPGKGGRWEIASSARTVQALRKRFDAWNAARLEEAAKAREAREAAEADTADIEDEVLDDADLTETGDQGDDAEVLAE